ncbi:MAG: IS110 family transposase [Aquificae bacterium]|nr:IS110 family transposase [Aquificota bacterium]
MPLPVKRGKGGKGKMETLVIGGDVCVNYTVFFIGATREFRRVSHSHEELSEFKNYILSISKGKPIIIYIEQTGRYSLPIASTFGDIATIKVVEGKKLKAFREWQGIDRKDDYRDAELLYLYGTLGGDAHTIDIQAYEIRGIVKRLIRLEKMKQMTINRIRQCIAVVSPELYSTWTKKKIQKNPEQLLKLISEKQTIFSVIKEEAIHELKLLKNLIEEEKLLRKRIENFPEEFPRWRKDFEILLSIPGISKFRAVVLISSYIDIARFKSFKAFKKYMGFAKSNEESGTSLKRQVRRVSNREVRRELYMLFLWLASSKISPPARPMAEYRKHLLKKTGGITKKAFWKFSDKLLRVIWHLLHTGEKYDPRKWGYTPDDVMGLDPREDVGERGSTKGGKEVSHAHEENINQTGGGTSFSQTSGHGSNGMDTGSYTHVETRQKRRAKHTSQNNRRPQENRSGSEGMSQHRSPEGGGGPYPGGHQSP